jgi:hypothetical protein
MLIPNFTTAGQLRRDQLLGRGQRLYFYSLSDSTRQVDRKTDRQAQEHTQIQMSYHSWSVERTSCLVRILVKTPRPECSSNPAYDSCMTKLEDLGFKSRQEQGAVVFSKTSRSALGFTQPPMTPALFLGVKRPEREAGICSAQVKHEWTNNSTPPYALTSTSPHFSIST